jgi:outer membrane beta-barrel protein
MIAAIWTPSLAVAQETKKKEFNDTIIVIQRKPFLRAGRVELEPTFHFSFNDSMVMQLSAGLNFNVHVLEWLYVGLTGAWQDWRFVDREANGFSGSYESVIDATDAIPEVSVVDTYAGAMVGLTPLNGKMAIFNSAVVHWDLSFGLGGGMVYTRANQFTGGGMFSIQQRWFLTDWFSMSFDFRGLMYYEELGKTEGLFTQLQAGLGFAFWLPTSFEYASDQ